MPAIGAVSMIIIEAMTTEVVARDAIVRLLSYDTCTLSNAIERLSVRPRNEGFMHGRVRCQFPNLPPVLGHAVTARLRSSMPPIHGHCYYDNPDWWEYVASMPAPRIVVMQDCDHQRGLGALFGEAHARICQALEGVAYVTDGSVRDVGGIEPTGFQLFAGGVSVSHAYAHVVEFGVPVDVGGLRVLPGDLLHGDRHGVLSIPKDVLDLLPAAADEVLWEDRQMFECCSDKEFSIDKLKRKLVELREKQRCE